MQTTYTTPVPDNKFNQQTRETIGEAIYLLGYIIRNVNWNTGTLSTTHAAIANATGFPVGTVKRWLQCLCEAGEITISRTLRGTIITITDYQPIARTRGVKSVNPPASNRSVRTTRELNEKQSIQTANALNASLSSGSIQSTDDLNDCSSADPIQSADDRNNRPPADFVQITGGLNHVLQNLYKIKNRNIVQKDSSLCSASKRPGQGNDLFDYEDPFDQKLRLANEKIYALNEDTRRSLMQQAMEEMEQDSKPFVRIFVRRNEQGELEPKSETGAEMVIARMGEILDRSG